MSSQPRAQHAVVFDLLSEYAAAFCEIAEIVFVQEGAQWDMRTAKFEVDVYFTFVLSASVLWHEHDMDAWEDLMSYCEERLLERHANLLSMDSLRDVIASRMERYGRVTNGCIERRDKPIWSAWIEWVCRSVTASATRQPIEADQPLIISDPLQRHRMHMRMLPIQFQVCGAFECCLKHLFMECTDFRRWAPEEMARRIVAAQREFEQIRKDRGHEIDGVAQQGLRLPAELWQRLNDEGKGA